MPEQGDIVLVPVPFTDLTSTKRRPVIVLSNDRYLRSSPDMLVVAMTSNPAPSPYGFTIDTPDLVRGRLNHAGTVRVDKVFTLSQQLGTRIFGQVNAAVLDRVRSVLSALVASTA